MTYSYREYEWTAFTEADFLDQGGNGSGIGCGDSFTMPGSATVCMSTIDNDPFLSGDTYHNENANDLSGQQAYVDGVAVGGQMYAERYHVLEGSDGRIYYMIEIEIEGHDAPGAGDDYFSFFGDVPPAGTELEVVSTCNVYGNWVDYKCLGAGDKIETGTISGTVFCDEDCDGISTDVTIVPGCDYTIEAEDMAGYGFKVVDGAQASGGELAKLYCAGGDGALCTTFDGKSGVYDVKIRVQDENDGQSLIKLKVGGVMVEAIRLDNDSDGGGSNDGGFSTYVIKDVPIATGDDVTIHAWGDGYEFVRIDNIVLEGQDTETVTTEPTKAGVTIKLLDLDGNVLDTTETDADGNYAFVDIPAGDYKIMGVAPDGTEFTIQDAGNDDSIDSDVDANGMSGVISVAGGTETDIDLGLKDAEELPGSLSGRYFCDTDDDDQDNGNGNEPGVEGVLVMLLDANGTPTGATTTTDSMGNYAFAGLAAGTYGVKFTDPDGVLDGKELINANVGDDASDSDAIGDTTMSMIEGIEVTAGQDTPDNDAGVEDLPGSLSGRYFCDTDDDDQDNGNGNEPGVEGVLVMLLDANGTPTGATTTTDSMGNYAFSGLAAGVYGVKFTDPDGVLDGKELINANVGDDASDSDAIGDTMMSVIETIEVFAGQDTPDNDAGVEEINDAPTPQDDAGRTCADETVMIDVLANDSDPEGDALTITEVDGKAIADGETVTTGSGVEVTLAGGKLMFDGEDAFEFLDINEEATDSISYTVSDGNGNDATANVDVTFCGDANSIQSLLDSFPAQVKYQIVTDSIELPVDGIGFDMRIDSSGDARFDGVVFEQAYCLSLFDPADGAESFADAPILMGDIKAGTDTSVFNADQISFANGQAAGDNLDLINWLINQEFEGPNVDAVDGEFTGWEVQRAIWELTDALDTDFQSDIDPGFGDDADVDFLVQQALDNGEGFVAGQGDLVSFIVDPNPVTAENSQPFIAAVRFEDYDCIC